MSRSHPMQKLGLMLALLLVAVTYPRRAAAQRGPTTSKDTVYFMTACPHDESLHPSEYTCPDSTMVTFRGVEMQSAKFTVTLRNGRSYTQTIKPGTDAIFLSNHALEKFLLPYYDSVNDTKKAEAIRAFVGRVNAKASSRVKPPASPKKKP